VHLFKVDGLVVGMLPAADIGAMDTPTGASDIEISCRRWGDRLDGEREKGN
jgi:hypothetical protein